MPTDQARRDEARELGDKAVGILLGCVWPALTPHEAKRETAAETLAALLLPILQQRDEARGVIAEVEHWRAHAMATAEAVVNDRPYPVVNLKRMAKEFIVQRLVEEHTRTRCATLAGLLAEFGPYAWHMASAPTNDLKRLRVVLDEIAALKEQS